MTAREALVARIEAHWPLMEPPFWWLWQARERPGQSRPRKVPVRVVGRGRLIAHDPSDGREWRSWAAVRRDHLAGLGDGVGVALGSELACLDLDDCVTLGGGLQQHAADLLRAVDGYVERSPGGGLHLIGWSDPALPPANRRAGRVELLQKGFLTVTGDRLPGRARDPAHGADLASAWTRLAGIAQPAVVLPRIQDAPPDLDGLLVTAARLRNANRFFSLWKGDVSSHRSASEADFALCRHLHFLLGPRSDAIDTAFRASVLYHRRPANWNRCAASGLLPRDAPPFRGKFMMVPNEKLTSATYQRRPGLMSACGAK